MRISLICFILLSSLCLLSCEQKTEVSPSFYHWKTRFELGKGERDILKSLGTERIYLRFFDIDIAPGGTGEVRPIAKIQASPSYPEGIEFVPCIFITNRSIKALKEEMIPDLARRIHELVFRLGEQYNLPSPSEVQIDCDWTPSTQERYFMLLDQLRPLLKSKSCELSCTIRLHQYKYPDQTGIPEVDRGMLMVYNIGDLDDPEESNSIFDIETVKSYLNPSGNYPLQLDVALPIFGWGVLLRNNKPIRLLNNVRIEEALQDSLVKKSGPNHVEVMQSHYFYGRYLYAGDIIRFESVSPGTLVAGAELIAKAIPKQESRHIALYHLDTLSIQHYAIDTLEIVYRAFH